MVMGDRIKPGVSHAAGKVKEVAGKTVGDQRPEADGKTGPVNADVKPAGDTAGAAARDIPSP